MVFITGYVLCLSPLTSALCRLPKEKLLPGSRPRAATGSDPGLGCGCTEGMVPPQAEVLLVEQRLSTELACPHILGHQSC